MIYRLMLLAWALVCAAWAGVQIWAARSFPPAWLGALAWLTLAGMLGVQAAKPRGRGQA